VTDSHNDSMASSSDYAAASSEDEDFAAASVASSSEYATASLKDAAALGAGNTG